MISCCDQNIKLFFLYAAPLSPVARIIYSWLKCAMTLPTAFLHTARAHGRGQGREPVERPFHHLRTDGDETEKRPPCPPRIIESVQDNGSYSAHPVNEYELLKDMPTLEENGDEIF